MDIDRINSRPYNNIYESIANADAIMLTGILIMVVGVIVLLKMYFSLNNYSHRRYILPICIILIGVALTLLTII